MTVICDFIFAGYKVRACAGGDWKIESEGDLKALISAAHKGEKPKGLKRDIRVTPKYENIGLARTGKVHLVYWLGYVFELCYQRVVK